MKVAARRPKEEAGGAEVAVEADLPTMPPQGGPVIQSLPAQTSGGISSGALIAGVTAAVLLGLGAVGGIVALCFKSATPPVVVNVQNGGRNADPNPPVAQN
ncbi:MAG TPA: hypothetical protein VGP68_12285, partial [Gemmataceae bacterium]|nr:hypothetical protein [Gemmataceae bacterium]